MSDVRNWVGRGIVIGDRVQVVSGTKTGCAGRVISSHAGARTCWIQQAGNFCTRYDYIFCVPWEQCELVEKAPTLTKINLFDGFLVFSEGHWATLEEKMHKTQDAAREHILRHGSNGQKFQLVAAAKGKCVQIKQHLEDIPEPAGEGHE